MKKSTQFYRRYSRDGRCKVICMSCYATVGTGLDRQTAERIEAEHLCAEWVQPERSDETLARGASWLRRLPALLSLERAWTRLPSGILLFLLVVLLYLIPTGLEILARTQVNTWVAVILPGNVAGCAVLILVLRRARMGVLLYTGLAACEICWHVVHLMRGVTMAWIADLVPTLAVLALLLIRRQGERSMDRMALRAPSGPQSRGSIRFLSPCGLG